MSDLEPMAARERHALMLSKWGNLLMGAAGVLAAWLSNSTAVLVDGLFSLIGFLAAVIGARVSETIHLAPDHRRPIGYAADESIYVTFRALTLLGLVVFAICNALLNIARYASGGDIPVLRFEPLVVYFVAVGAICFGLAVIHHSTWRKTGRSSDVLRLEAKAATFDGAITLAAGAGLSIFSFLKGGPIGWVAPIGDSLIVLLLCFLVIGRYYGDFMQGIGELAGVSAAPEHIASARRAVRRVIDEAGGRLVDLSVLKLGRRYLVQVYYDPNTPILAASVDDLTRRIDAALAADMGQASSTVLVSRHGRVLPE